MNILCLVVVGGVSCSWRLFCPSHVTRVSASRYEALKLKYVVTPTTLAQCRPTLVLMHPLPRVGEIDPACDRDPRAAYFRQMEAGLHVRAALLALVLGAKLSTLL